MFLDILRTIVLVAYDLVAFIGIRWAAFASDRLAGDNLIYCAPGKDRDDPLFETPLARPVMIGITAFIQWAAAILVLVTAVENAVLAAVVLWAAAPFLIQAAVLLAIYVFCMVTVFGEFVFRAFVARWKQVRSSTR